MNKKSTVLLIGLITFLALVVLSIVFYKERIIFADPAFQLSYMIRDDNFAIQVNRFAAVLSKIFPYLAIKLSLSLNIIVLIYSLSFPLYNLMFFVIIFKYFKNIEWAIILLLYNILIVSHSFYWPAIELNQGVAVMMFYFAFISYLSRAKTVKIIHWIVTALLIATIVFSHPLIIIPFVFIHIYLYFFNINTVNKNMFTIGVLFTLTTLIIKRIFFRNWYDDMQMESLNNFVNLFPNYWDIPSNKKFLQYFINDYYISGIILLSVFIYLILKRELLKIVLIFSFIIGYILIINISFPNGSDNFFSESKYMLLSIFIAIPFVFDLIPRLKTNYLFAILLFIIIIRLFHIYNTHSLYSERVNWLSRVLTKTEKLHEKKLIINKNDTPTDTLMLTWASSYEFLLLSTIEKNNPRSILITEDPLSFKQKMKSNNTFLDEWRVYKYDKFPKRYFNFKDSSKYHYYKLKN